MKKLSMSLKVLFNIFLFLFYSLFSIIAGNFIFGLVLTLIDREIPSTEDPIHLKLAVLVVFLSLLLTLLFRKFFYLRTFENNNNVLDKKYKNDIKIEDELEIYVNKEIK